jgi:DNA-binding MurR/RpiR family transcriptional regulator
MSVVPLPDRSLRQEESALDRIEAHRDELSGALQRVADYVLANPWETRGISIVELARRAGVSENAVTRFCLRIGYAGYREFATQLSSTLGRVMGAAYFAPAYAAEAATDDSGTGGAFQIVDRAFAMELQVLNETRRLLDATAVEQAVDALSAAGRILLIGLGGAAPAAATAAYRLALLGLTATAPTDPYALVAQANTLATGDIIFGISANGQNRLVVEAMKIARERGATAIGLTTAPRSPFAKSADILLIVAGAAPAASSQLFTHARVASALMVEAIVAAVAGRHSGGAPPEFADTVRRHRELLEYR